jgi:toxin CcdB
VRHLNPELQHDGRRLVLATRLIASVRRSALHRTGSVADQGDLITRAVDVLMAGV